MSLWFQCFMLLMELLLMIFWMVLFVVLMNHRLHLLLVHLIQRFKFSCVDDTVFQANHVLTINAKSTDNGFGEATATRVDVDIIDPSDVGRIQFVSGAYTVKEDGSIDIPLERLGDQSTDVSAILMVETPTDSPGTDCSVDPITLVGDSSTPVVATVKCNDESVLLVNVKLTIKIMSYMVYNGSSSDLFDPAVYFNDERIEIDIDYEDNDVPFVKFSDSLTIDMDEVDSTDLFFARGGDTSVSVTATVQLVSNVASCTLSGGSTISFDADSDTANETLKVICVDDNVYSNSPSISIKLTGVGAGFPFDDSIDITYTDNINDSPSVKLTCPNEVLERNDIECTVTRSGDITKELVVNRLTVTGSTVCSFSYSSIVFGAGISSNELVKFNCVDDVIYQLRYSQPVVIYADNNGFGELISASDSIDVIDELDKPRIAVEQIKIARIKEGSGFEVVITRKGDVNHSISTSLTLEDNFGCFRYT
eukprot:TRINITY_DN1307_c0_g1_i3.p1 TRINITY_DN1307_c0_g1~~TRINITY_DN1307_c0_g1_i3.p1  ORF type:complete len:479 (+),score=166.13 TRINITY_DN1307_c0_g1_i3:197-1633(+)